MRIPQYCIALAATLAVPGAALAGGYGTAGVKDATVGPAATATATVWCPALNAEIPVTLQEQMDCGGAVAVGVAKPKVAREFFTTTRRSGDDNDRNRPPRQVAIKDPAPKSGPIDKWGRLGQLGVNQSNYHQQSQSFLDKVDAFRTGAGTSGDWSNFNP